MSWALWAGALLSLQGTPGLAGWQWLFLVEGSLPVLLSLVFLIYLPNTPTEATWLSAEERAWLLSQPKHHATADGSHDGLRHALVDPLVWKLGLAIFCMLICAYGYSLSAPAILQKVTALNVTKVGFLVAFMGLLNALGLLLNAIYSDRAGERYWHIIIPLLFNAKRLSGKRAFAQSVVGGAGPHRVDRQLLLHAGHLLCDSIFLSQGQVSRGRYRGHHHHRNRRWIYRSVLDGSDEGPDRKLSARVDYAYDSCFRCRSDHACRSTRCTTPQVVISTAW